MISVRSLTKRFGALTAVDNIDLEIPDGEFFAFLGPNAAGKTTTIKMLAGLLRPTSGEVRIGGYLLTVTEMDGRRVARVRVSPYAPGAAVPGLAGPPGTAEPAPPDGDDGDPSPPRGGGGVESQNASGT